MRAYRPATTVNSDDPIPPTAVPSPAPENTDSEPLCYTQTGEKWLRILAQTTKHCRRHQLEVLAGKKAREARESVFIIPRTTVFRPAPPRTEIQHAAWIEEAKTWSRDFARKIERHKQREMRERAHAKANAQVAELASYKRTWSILCAGLGISAFLLLILFTDVLRDTKGDQLGVSITCDPVPSLTDISPLSVVYWTAVALYVIARLAAPIATERAAALSQVLGRCADAAYYRRQSRHRIVVNEAGGFVVLEALTIGFVAMVQGDIRCVGVTGDRCLRVALMTPMVMCWRFLGSTVSVLFLGSEYGSFLAFIF